MALSMDSQSSVSLFLAIQATGLPTFAPVGLIAPTEYTSLFAGHTGDVATDTPAAKGGEKIFGIAPPK